ncbi:MAG TPA: endonuclease/exonuclease/phosphatase family protein, partial [Caulobacteraceae bacterium]|nr:endonuclease/exonuclease/phosphatase family protein [Caulobacteraceae bacterium]
GLVPREQQRQARTLAGEDWLGGVEGPVILLGDLNATRASSVYRTLAKGLDDARRTAAKRLPSTTFPSAFPVLRIDHVFVSAEIKATRIEAPYDPVMRLASDHLPLVMDFEVEA